MPVEVQHSEGRGKSLVRFSLSLAAGVLSSLVAAAVDASFARGAASEPPGIASTVIADAGLLVPVGLAVGAMVGVASAVLHPARAPSIRRTWNALDHGSETTRSRRGFTIAAFAPGVVLAVAIAGQVAFRILASEASPISTGAALGLSAAAIGAVTLVVATGIGVVVGDRHVLHSAKPVAAGAGVLAVVLAAYGIWSGTTNGEGGVLGIFGVLKREELDLRAPGLAGGIALAAYLVPAAASRVPALLAVLVAIGPLALTAYAAAAALDNRKVALTLERGAPLGRLGLSLGRKLTDADGDGASALFGGGDCDDGNPAIHPGADDVPENGVDEDCSGEDDEKIVLERAPEPAPKDAAEWVRGRIPEELGVVLITVDTLRFDLGFMGYERPISPNIDRLAEQSVVFEKAYALASYTGKSIGPMLIGKYPSETHRGWAHFNKFGDEETFLQERLTQSGIRTMNVQGHWYFKADTGIGRGFDVEDHSAAPRVPQMEGDTTVNSDALTDAAIRLLSNPENVKGRFYLWVHYLDPHAAYVRHEEFDFGRKGRDLYDAEVAFVDKHVGRLLNHIDKSDYAERTAIILTSDHGEAFGEHGIYRHGRELWEEMVRVPWLFRVPGAKPRRHEVRRSLIDLVPTVLDLFGLPKPGRDGQDFVSGQSLLFDIYGPPGHEVTERIIFIDMSAGPYNGERQAFIQNDMKLTAALGRPLGLYNLGRDPGETKDLLGNEELAEPIIARFKAFRRSLHTVKVKPTE